jgi:hypothetical protein
MNVTLRKAIYKKKILFHKYQKCRASENWNNYTTQRNYVTTFTGARGTDLPPPFFLTYCLQIYFQ